MLACVGRPRSFAELARYLINGPAGTTPDPYRVAWLETRNLPTDDPIQAAAIMEATARFNSRITHPAYHLMIAWGPDERPDQALQQQIARETLELAELTGHQVLIAGHGDTGHAHLHMLINRVHPETGKAWSTSHDYRRFDRIMALLAEAHGLKHAQAHAFNAEITSDLATQSTRRAHHAAKRGAATDRPQWSKADSRALGESLGQRIVDAQNWDQIEAAIAATGLTLEAKGQGLIVGDKGSYSKFSALGLEATAAQLERRFGETFRAYRHRRPVFAVDKVDIAKAIGSRDVVARAVQEVQREREARLADADLARQLENDLKRVLVARSPRPAKRSDERSSEDPDR